MRICLFEDHRVTQLYPITLARPAFDIRVGAFTLLERLRLGAGTSLIQFRVRDYLEEVSTRLIPEAAENQSTRQTVLVINSRLAGLQADLNQLTALPENNVLVNQDVLIGGKLAEADWNRIHAADPDLVPQLRNLPTVSVTDGSATLLQYPWDVVRWNGDLLRQDAERIFRTPSGTDIQVPGIHCVEEENIWLGSHVSLKPGVVLDASEGPIMLDDGARVLPNAFLEGPLYVGKNSLIKAGAKIYENTTIGPVCKVGGEVEESILHSYSNKQHEGFLGHAYLGSWVNIGADSNNSDLKNNYGTVRMWVNGQWMDSGTQFLGMIMGDHSKCGINSTINTGTVIGFNCNLYGPDLHPKYIPSFTWGGAGHYVPYQLEKAMAVAERVMARRKVTFDDADRRLFREIFIRTEPDRKANNILP